MDIFVGIIVGLLVLTLLVILHEFGHFIVARHNGVNVLEFGIGFPPRAIAWIKNPETGKWQRYPKSKWKKEKLSKVVYSSGSDKGLARKGMIFSINWLPIGGFCQMDGESAADTRKGTFGATNFWGKTKILFGGVLMNWITAFVIFTILAWTGMPLFLDNQFTVASDTQTASSPVEITSVAENSPASKAGIKVDDKIIAVDGNAVTFASDITEYNGKHAGETVVYTIRRLGTVCTNQPDCYIEPCPCLEEEKVTVTTDIEVLLNPEGSDYLLGVTMKSNEQLSYSTWSAPIVGLGLTAQLTGETFKGLGSMLWNLVRGVGSLFSFDANTRQEGQEAISEVGDSVSGPVGIIGVLFPAFTSAGPANLAFLAALISVSLACMNILPIPALDGGRWFLIAIYKLRRKKLTKETEEKIVARAFIILLVIMFIVTILDITRFF
jgi:regulator of sigma E protease